MGYIIHHGIAVVSFDKDRIIEVHARARVLCLDLVTDIIHSPCNGYCSFFVSPDGSKEGWGNSVRGDEARRSLMKFMDSYADEDGGNAIEYCEFIWGGDDGVAKITAHNGMDAEEQEKEE